jgi:hypothetical protein
MKVKNSGEVLNIILKMSQEIPKEDYFDHHVFEEPVYDCEED